MSLYVKELQELKKELSSNTVEPLPCRTRLWLLEALQRVLLEDQTQIRQVEVWRESNPNAARVEDFRMQEDIEKFPALPIFQRFPNSLQSLNEMINKSNCFRYIYEWLSNNPPLERY